MPDKNRHPPTNEKKHRASMPNPPNTYGANMQYRRFYRQGSLYFFTVVAYQRRPILTNPDVMAVLKAALKTV